jgi:hypothetical protein
VARKQPPAGPPLGKDEQPSYTYPIFTEGLEVPDPNSPDYRGTFNPPPPYRATTLRKVPRGRSR